MVGPAALIIATGFVTCYSPYAGVAVLSLAVGSTGFQYAGWMANPLDIAPPFAGVLFGISNTAATVPGIIAPYVVGLLTTDVRITINLLFVFCNNIICRVTVTYRRASGKHEKTLYICNY